MLLELHTKWRSKIKMDQGGSFPEADDALRRTALPRSQTKIFISNMKPLFLLPFHYLPFLSINAWEDNAL